MRTRFYPLRILLLLSSAVLCCALVLTTSSHSVAAPQSGPAHQALPVDPPADLAPNKTDYNQENDPKNKLIGSPSWQTWLALPDHIKVKVDPRIIGELRGQILPAHRGGTAENHIVAPSDQRALEQTRFIVYMENQLDLRRELDQRVFASSAQQRSAAVSTLSDYAQRSQAALHATLDERMRNDDINGYHSFFIVNAVAVEGNLDTIIDLARRYDVARIQANYPLVPLWESQQSSPSAGVQSAATQDLPDEVANLDPRNWNIDLVDADRVWKELGVLGDGAVVAGFDTGVEYTHPALKDTYRGRIGAEQYDHNYSWFEPDSNLYPDGNLGPSLSDEPSDCDFSGTHGTHTMGTMVGRGQPQELVGGTNIGMAPNARWIAVPGICNGTMPGNLGDDIGGLKAFQWLLCPTDLSGDLATADCSKAPDVVNNSWGSANPVNDVLHPAIEALRAAGIAPVFASGNPGAGKGSVGTPGNSPAAITVGATDRSDTVASFSGRGPSFYENEQKPELTAPGVNVRSSVGTAQYENNSGTSMAAPHVAGLIALMVSADLADDVRDFSVDDLERFMTYTAVDLGREGHDDDYGFGRIDAYAAVSWVKSAGDLRGVIRDAATNEPIAQATVTGSNRTQSFSISSGATGQYSITAPAGIYNIEVTAWGYKSKQFSSQTVFPESLSLADFQLEPEPQALVSGAVTTGQSWPNASTGPTAGSPIANAQISVIGHPEVTTATGANGTYSMTLPSGTHQLEIRADNHRIITTSVEVAALAEPTVELNPISQNISVDAAPRLLLVDADASGGWFLGWSVYPVFEYSLNQSGYPYDLWRIEHLDVTDVETADNSNTKRGVPSLATLQQYDAVLWVHSGCSDQTCFVGGTPQSIGAEELLISYLDGGGRLILSGQNVSAWADAGSPLMRYLGSQHVTTSGGSEGEQLTGSDFLADLSVEITNAPLYGFRNGLLFLSPDAVQPSQENAVAVPILRYRNGTSAALATSPCDANYRSVFFAAGYENFGVRNSNLVPDAVAALDRSIQWLAQEKQPYDLSVTTDQLEQSETQGGTIRYEISIANSGLQSLQMQLNISGAMWETQIYSGTFDAGVSPDSEVEETLPLWDSADVTELLPCSAQPFTVEVEVPESAENGAQDLAQIDITTDAPEAAESVKATSLSTSSPAHSAPNATEQVTLTSIAFASWENQPSMPTNRYRMAVESLPNDVNIYAIGGWNNFNFDTSALNERYDACTGRWTEMARLPDDRTAIGSTVWAGKIYVSGGMTWSYSDYDFIAQDDLFIYDPISNSWRSGPPLPKPMYGHAMVAHRGKLYIFGGRDNNDEFDTAYVLNIGGSTWREIRAIPGGERSYSDAAALGNKIYLVGGWPANDHVEVYDPIANQWSTAADLNFGRQSMGVAAGQDGYLYVSGGGNGWDAVNQVERYNPTANDWEIISALRGGSRVGSGLAYAAGQLHTLGGNNAIRSNESLHINSAFCLSDRELTTAVAQPGGTLSYRVDIEADVVTLTDVEVVDSIPVSTTFIGFDANGIGAVFNEEARQIEWRGDLPANATGLSYTYTVALDEFSWPSGSEIASSIRFQADLSVSDAVTPTTQIFTRTTRSRVFVADFSPSTLAASADTVIEGETLTYTVDLKSSNAAGSLVTVSGNLPNGMSLLQERIRWPVESPDFTVSDSSFELSGIVPSDQNALINGSENYIWNDSFGATSVGDREVVADYEWIDIEATGDRILNGDDRYLCDQPIDFPFQFYGELQDEFCVSTNGFISFDRSGFSGLSNECPLPSVFSNRGIVAGLWDDLVTGAIYTQHIGQSPSRALIIQFVDARRYGTLSEDEATFQIILYETGDIKIQFLTLPENLGGSSTTGLSNPENSLGITYACNTLASLSEESAVHFTPPGGGIGNATSPLTFVVQLADKLPINSTISNTVWISDTIGVYTRTLETALNPVGLTTGAQIVGNQRVEIGEQFTYQFVIENIGQLTAGNVSFVFPINEETTYIADSLLCTSGECSVSGGEVKWAGQVAGREQVTIEFQLEITEQLEDSTFIIGIATIDDGFGQVMQAQAGVFVRSSNLQESLVAVTSPYIELAQTALINIVVRNTGSVQTESRAVITLPPELEVIESSLVCGTGQCMYNDGTVTWQGTSPPRSAVPIRFFVQTPATADYGERFEYAVTLTDLNRQEISEFSGQLIMARKTYYPVNIAPASPQILYMPIVP